MRVRHTPGTVLHQAIIICEREPDQESENPDYTVHHIGSDSVAKDWYGVAGVYDIKDIGEAFIEFQRKLTTYDAIPSF
jgi:hypothetical protein